MADWNEDSPGDSDFIAQYPANERAARAALVANFGVDHSSTDDANVGKHVKVSLLDQASDPAGAADSSTLYAKDVSGASQLFWRSEAGTAVQLTAAGGLRAESLVGTVADARLSSNVPLKNASNTFTGSTQTISATQVSLAFNETDAAVDNRLWDLQVSSEALRGRIINDEASASAAWLTVNRTGITVDSIALAATAITLNGVSAADYARLSSNNTFTGGTNKFENATPGIFFSETDASANNKLWGFFASSEQLKYQLVNDELSSFVSWLTVDRLGTTVSAVDFPSGTLQYGGIEVGYRDIPKGSSLAERGKVLEVNTNQTLNTGMSAGDTFAILNVGGSAITISQGAGLTLYLTGTTTTGNRTLAPLGWATVWCRNSTEYFISGPGVT